MPRVDVPFCVTLNYISSYIDRYENLNSTNASDLTYIVTCQTVFLSLLFIIGIPANIIVIVVISKQKQSARSLTNCLLINLASADVLIFITSIPYCLLDSYGLTSHNFIQCK